MLDWEVALRDASATFFTFPVTTLTTQRNFYSSQIIVLLCYRGRKQMKTVFQRMEYITPQFETYQYIYFSRGWKK